MIKLFAGIDVQIKRDCCYYVVDDNSTYIASGWITSNDINRFHKIFSELCRNEYSTMAIGIDAPRMPLKKLRQRYYVRSEDVWIIKEKKSIGRECEVVINSHRLANCQWTNTFKDSPEWMKLGYKIFDSLKEFKYLHEVFPSASYRMLENKNLKYELSLNKFRSGPKDMLDASVAAITVKEFHDGHGCEVGNGDGLGAIVLPRNL